jgi:hypothetical protein
VKRAAAATSPTSLSAMISFSPTTARLFSPTAATSITA